MEKYEKLNLNTEQRTVIEDAVRYGLDENYIDLIALPVLSAAQMKAVFHGAKSGLNEIQIRTMADSRFNPEQMEEIENGFHDGLDSETVAKIMQPNISAKKMADIRRAAVARLMKSAPDLFKKEDIQKLVLQSKQQSEYLEQSMSAIRDMHRFITENPPDKKDESLLKELEKKNKEIEELKAKLKASEDMVAWVSEKFDESQELAKKLSESNRDTSEIVSFDQILRECFHGRKGKKPVIPDIVRFMSTSDFNAEQLEQIRLGHEAGLSLKEIKAYAKPGTDAGKMECMRKILVNLKKGINGDDE